MQSDGNQDKLPQVEMFRDTMFSVGWYTKLKKVTLVNFSKETSVNTALKFVIGIKSLEMLVFGTCYLEDIFGLDDQNHCLRVKHLKLCGVLKLKQITKKGSQHLQHVRTLHIDQCGDLLNLVPSLASLRYLTTLHVEFCSNVRNLVPASSAKTMEQLTEMKVVNCLRIEEIVAKDVDGAENDAITFKKLKVLELSGLSNFNSFCSHNCTFSFPLLEQVSIKECPRMNIFFGGPISTPRLRWILFEDEQHWEGTLNDTISSQLRFWVGEQLEEGRRFRYLESLVLVNNTVSSRAISANQMEFLNKLRSIVVRDCDSIQVVFDLDGHTRLLPSKLEKVELRNLPVLTQLCNRAPTGILDFSSLLELRLVKCSRLVYAFTWSMATCLSQLGTVELEDCEMMETLIVDDEDAETRAIFSLMYKADLKNMPKFSSIYSGRGELECPSLQLITIMECPNIKAFISTHTKFSHRVLPHPQTILSVDMKSIRGLIRFEESTNNFSNVKSLQVYHFSGATKSGVPLVHFLSRLPNLKSLNVHDSTSVELLNSSIVGAPTLPPITDLELHNLVGSSKTQLHASLFRSLPLWSASFQNVSKLSVRECNQMTTLMPPSVANNMVHLYHLSVNSCKMLTEIVGAGSGEVVDDIVFKKLRTIYLYDLQRLEGFSLKQCNFKFPCLENVVMSECSNLRIFCHGIVETPMLQYVQDMAYDRNRYWEGNINATIKSLYQKMVLFWNREIKLSAFPLLKEKWEAQLPNDFLHYVKRLEVDDCDQFLYAIPSAHLQKFETLEVLIVEKCGSVEQVIDLEGLNANEHAINPMKKLEELQLIDLPKLKDVLRKDPQHTVHFDNLQILKVHNCGSLTFILNLSMALSLHNLQHLEVKDCSLVKHIIMTAEGEDMQKYQPVLSSLQSMTLQNLTKLLSFCSTSAVVECASLKIIEVVDCPYVELFSSTFSDGQHSIVAFLGNKMVIPGLDELKVEWKTLKDDLICNYKSEVFSRLKCIELAGFQDEESASLPPTFLHQFKKLEKLSLANASVEQINLDDLILKDDKDPESLALLTGLKLLKLPNLKHLVGHDCESVALFQNLEDLEVVECSSLKILVPPSVLLHNLTDLSVSKCDGLVNLMSAPTARSLVQLRRMKVKDCKMMQEVVAIASDGEEYEIRFSQLEYLELDDLPSITCFSSGNCSFHFPSLQQVIITLCPNMKLFADRVSVTPKLRKIKTGRQEYEWQWEGNLNDTIQWLYMEKEEDERAAHNFS